MSAYDFDSIIIGAGLTGLAAAQELQAHGKSVMVLEASDGVGGRVRTDVVDGHLLDRGFQVMLAAYPEARRLLDYTALNLRSFEPGALVQLPDGPALVSDPFRRPLDTLATARAPIGSLFDKARIAKLRHDLRSGPMEKVWDKPDQPTLNHLRAHGFSDHMIESFFRPLFAGISLDPTLQSSSRMFDFVFRMLGEGDNVVPAHGMQRIPEQLAAKLTRDTVRLHARVTAITPNSVTIQNDVLSAHSIIVATEGPGAIPLLSTAGVTLPTPGSQPVSCVYFSTDTAPIDRAAIVLNGKGPADGPITNLAVMSLVSAAYAPPGRHLVSVSCVGAPSASIEQDVRAQLVKWFGASTSEWDHLRTYHIAHAQPSQPTLDPHERPIQVEGIYVAGDHRDQASIQGALRSGTRAARAVLEASA
jgi:phytoene dehydrogenase-like protein